ncbi:MAG: cell division protein FtsA, partial [bacterium]|nr:cell division protein FtsA [bacterium]
MRRIYTGIDLGSDSIKIVVSEVFNNKFHILASTSVKSRGIKRGLIIDKDKAKECLNKGIKNIEETIGLRIKEAVVNVSSNNRSLSVTSGSINIEKDEVTGEDVVNVLSNAIENKVENGYELITIIPIVFSIDNRDGIFDPKGKSGNVLSVKAVMATVPKENLFSVLELCSLCDIEAKDVVFGTIGDYYECKGKDTDSEIGAIINIGSDTIDVSVFNKGIIIKNDIINLGSKNIDKDIAYVYGLDLVTSRSLKENFSVCSRKYADSNDQMELKISDEDILKINQYEISEIVESRVTELLKLAKKSINSLTNRKISYIIVTGG